MDQENLCQQCTTPFIPRPVGAPQIYCSPDCRIRANRDRQAARIQTLNEQRRNARAAKCGECGGPVVQPELGRPKLYCSPKCNRRVHNRRSNRRRLPMRNPTPKPRACAYCKAMFVPRRNDQIYCPGSWCVQYAYQARRAAGAPLRQVEQQLRCQECDKEFTAFKSNARWCSLTCKNRNTNRVMSRRRGSAPRVPYTDREIFERDQWRCHLCRKPVDPDLPRTHRDGATIDHILPISLGGADEPSNVATAHWHYNHKKRAQLTEQLGATV
jgi:HNH endonuclease